MNADHVKALDKYVGGALVNVLFALDKIRFRKKKKIDTILVIMFWGIGSVINAMPVLRALKEKFPGARITVLAPGTSADLFYKNKFVDEALFVNLGMKDVIRTVSRIRNRFDVAIDTEHWLNISALFAFFAAPRRIGFSNRKRSKLYTDAIAFNPDEHAVINNLNLVSVMGAETESQLIKIETSNKDKKAVSDFLRSSILNQGLLIGIAPGAGETHTYRRWSKEKFTQLADSLVEKLNAAVVFVGAPGEKSLIEDIQKNMKQKSYSAVGFSLGKSMALIEKCTLFIGNDSGPVHMSAAQGTPTIGIYGPETPVIFGPWGKNCVAVYKDLDCSPSIKVYEGKYEDCKNDYKCLSLISVEEIMYYAERLLVENIPSLLISSRETF